MAKQFEIHLIWVPEHRNNPGNCQADELASLGTTLQVPPELACIGTPLSTCKIQLRQMMITDAGEQKMVRTGPMHSHEAGLAKI